MNLQVLVQMCICVDVQTEMQRCEVHRHGGEEVQRWCSKVVKMFSGAE
jgi:hypothetical protein